MMAQLSFCPPTLVASLTAKKVHMLAEVAGMKLAKRQVAGLLREDVKFV